MLAAVEQHWQASKYASNAMQKDDDIVALVSEGVAAAHEAANEEGEGD